jgi:uncharacterized protein (DUF2384 family)
MGVAPASRRARSGRAAGAKRKFAPARKANAAARPGEGLIEYDPRAGVEAYLQELADATPAQRIAIERHGVKGAFIKDLARRMSVPASRMFAILGVPKATVEKKAATNQVVTGVGAIATLGMVRLLAIAREIIEESTAPEAKDFDAVKWLGQWIEIAQPALGGRRPSELIDTPTGVESVARVLGSLISGSYQ